MDVLLKRPNEPENLKNTDILIVGQGGEEREREDMAWRVLLWLARAVARTLT